MENRREDPREDKAGAHESYLAILNILEDFHEDSLFASKTNWAILNVLDDFDVDKKLLSDTNRAVINILEDLEAENRRTEELNAQLERRVRERTAELARSEERFRLLVEGVGDYAIFMLDVEGRVATWNAGAGRIKGYRQEEVIGRHLSLFYTEEDKKKDRPNEELRAAVAHGQVKDEGWRVRKDGSQFIADVLITAIRDQDGKLLGFVNLTRDITERKAAEGREREALRQEMLLKEIHHRVKNNLQVISSLLYLQSTSVKDEKTLEILAESQSRVKSIALVHEKLYRTQDLEKLDFGEYVQDLVAEMIRTYGVRLERVALHTDLGQVYLGIDTAIPCGLIINELVSNAFKHAFPSRTGEIWISVHAIEDGRYRLRVRDNGVGIRKDFDLKTSKTLGLKLVSDLTKQLEGELSVSGGEHTDFTISFSELRYKERG